MSIDIDHNKWRFVALLMACISFAVGLSTCGGGEIKDTLKPLSASSGTNITNTIQCTVDETTVTSGATDMETLGAAICTVGKHSDAMAMFELYDPVSYQELLEIVPALGYSLDSFVEVVEDQMKADPLEECCIEKTESRKCSEDIIEKYNQVEIVPDSCGTISLKSRLKSETNANTDSVSAIQIGDRWYLYLE